MTFHLLKDDWGGRRQLTRQIEKIFRCRISTPRRRHASFHLLKGRWGVDGAQVEMSAAKKLSL
jgi:hypothetical protein